MNTVVDAYLATWNCTDMAERTRLLAQHWSPDATYVDPLAEASGTSAIDATIGAVHAQFPGFVFTQVGRPDTHHQQTRFQWGLGPADSDPIIVGFDVVVTDGDGRIRQVLGFLDKVPA